MQARASSARAVPAFVTALLPAAARRPALAVQILLLTTALALLMSFYSVVQGAVARGPAKPAPAARPVAALASADTTWQCETPPAGALHNTCRRVATVPSEGTTMATAGLQRVSFGR